MSASTHGLDTETEVFFYEQEFYCLSNFSSFRVIYCAVDFDTAEHAYHWCRFLGPGRGVARDAVLMARSAHEALQLARHFAASERPDWSTARVPVMREILRAKTEQHEYVRRKLLETGDRRLVENSWRDDFWGWGPRRDGLNVLGRLWAELRAELAGGTRDAAASPVLPPSLAVKPNIPHDRQTVDQLRAELAYWREKVSSAPGPASASASGGFAEDCARWIWRRAMDREDYSGMPCPACKSRSTLHSPARCLECGFSP